jgi:subtilisin family serine protease
MTEYEPERLAELLRALPPAPERWVRLAQEIPRRRRRTRPFGRFLEVYGGPAAVVAHSALAANGEEEPADVPAWSLQAGDVDQIRLLSRWPERVDREWAWGGATGEGARVCIIDSGIDVAHPLVGAVDEAVAVVVGEDGSVRVEEDSEGDLCGHGTACAGIIRALAPGCSIHSVRVLGSGFTGSGPAFIGGLRWALEQRFDVINMSLSTTKREFGNALHELADAAYFRRSLLVASAHNMPVESYPWRFASVVSVGSHEDPDPFVFYYNPSPPVEFFARGVDVDVAWCQGEQMRCTGNSFATPHIAGICALILSKHPDLRPFELKSLLYLLADNVGGSK